MKYVDIELDKPRKLRFRVPDAIELEKQTGEDFFQALMLHRLGYGNLTLCLWLGLRWEDHKLTQKATAELLSEYLEGGGNPGDVWDWIDEAAKLGGLVREVKQGEAEAGENPAE